MRQKFTSVVSRSWAPWAILGLGLIVSIFGFYVIKARVDTEARLRFDNDARTIGTAIQSRVWAYYDVLDGFRGLFRASGAVTRASFRQYFLSLNLAERYPGFQVVSFTRYLILAQRREFEQRVRGDTSIERRGYPDFRITPPGDRSDYYVIEYVEPMAGNENILGFDTHSSATRVLALERARDFGELVASAPFRFLSASVRDKVGFALRVPIYRNGQPLPTVKDRHRAFVGVVSATFVVGELVTSVLAEETLKHIRLQIHDKGFFNELDTEGTASDNLLFDSMNGRALPGAEQKLLTLGAAALHQKVKLNIGGRLWDAQFAELSGYTDTPDQMLPRVVLIAGIVTSVLLFFLARLLASANRRAIELANRMTEDLHDSNQRFRELAGLSSDWFWEQDAEFRYTEMSGGLDQKGGLRSERTIGKKRWELPGVAASEEQWLAHQKMLEQHLPFRDFEYPIDIDGNRHWYSISGNPIFGADGTFRGYRGAGKDITERKRAEKRLAIEYAVTRTLTAAEDVDQAVLRVLKVFCETLNWTYGAYWRRDSAANFLASAQVHSVRPLDENSAKALAAAGGTVDGGGLLARAWSSGEPVWIANIAEERDFERHEVAAKLGFRGMLAVPVVIGRNAVGIMEFFCEDVRQPDESSLQLSQVVGSQIGQFMARKGAEQNLQFVAAHDPLTLLPNRITFNQRLGHALAQAQRHKRPLAVLFLDLDRFKIINDTLGHDAGDYMLREIASRLQQCLRESDTICRQGGDEFVVLIEEFTEVSQLGNIAQKLLDAIAKPFAYAGQEYLLTASVGISTYPDDSADVQSLLKNADIAMYRAKEHGKNNYQFYSAQMNVHTLERLSLESALRRAIERNEFLLYYQPKIEIWSRRITGVEALIRWQHPEFGLISPARFIPLAEETGLIVPIGEWVLRTACAAARSWRQRGLPQFSVAVNLSARQFTSENLLSDITSALRASRLDADALELEITESMIMSDPERSVQLLEKLKAQGIRLAIDDFGTGYSSLGYLKRFPIDCVKVDRSFIMDLPNDPDDVAITTAIIAMAHSLQLTVVAEGVETDAQFAFLKQRRCDEMQGFHFSGPLPEDELVALLHEHVAATGT